MADGYQVQWIMPAKTMAQNYNQFLKVMVLSRRHASLFDVGMNLEGGKEKHSKSYRVEWPVAQ